MHRLWVQGIAPGRWKVQETVPAGTVSWRLPRAAAFPWWRKVRLPRVAAQEKLPAARSGIPLMAASTPAARSDNLPRAATSELL